MKRHPLLAIALVGTAACAAPPAAAWLPTMPAGLVDQERQVRGDAFFEVPASRLDAAESALRDAPVVVADERAAAYYGHPGFACVAPAKPYLVRVLSRNGATGSFLLLRAGTALVVAHAALGQPGPTRRSALVACLAARPSAVYSSLSTAG